MRTFLELNEHSKTFLICACFVFALTHRLPAWQSDLTIWSAAATSDSNDPWALNNAAHYAHDARTVPWLAHLIELPIPAWLPNGDRHAYFVGYISLAETMRVNGHREEANAVMNAALHIAPSMFILKADGR